MTIFELFADDGWALKKLSGRLKQLKWMALRPEEIVIVRDILLTDTQNWNGELLNTFFDARGPDRVTEMWSALHTLTFMLEDVWWPNMVPRTYPLMRVKNEGRMRC